MKRACQSSADRITNLHVDLIHHILVFLPIKDAAKTSVLSRKWRNQWRSIPQLVFDDGFARTYGVAESESESKTRFKFILLDIFRVLYVHDGPITKFVLSIPGMNYCNEIDSILLRLSNKGVQDLTLKFWYHGADGNYQVHSSLFSALHLKYLRLEECEIPQPPSWFAGFSKLTHLQLEEVTLPYNFFENFLTKFPILESLSAAECYDWGDELQIVAPFLKSFHFERYGNFCHISFKDTPLLSFVSLDVHGNNKHEMEAFFAPISTAQQFSVNAGFLRMFAAGNRNVPTRLPSPLHGLEVLEISMDSQLDDDDSLELDHVFLCLIMSSPNLRRLKFKVESDFEPGTIEFSSIRKLLEAEDYPGFSDCFQHLKVFRIEESFGTQVELDLVRFVLATAPRLQQIHITPARKLSSDKALKFTVEAMRYKRASPEAEFIYDLIDKKI